MQFVIRFSFLLHLIFTFHDASAQRQGKNLPQFDFKKFYGGTMLGTTSTTYAYEINAANLGTDSIQQITLNSGPGISIQIPVFTWNPHPVINLRFAPSISFHETQFLYTYYSKGKLKTKSTRTQPTPLNFPLLLKLNTKRLNNFGAYAISGFSYSYDLAGQENVDQSLGDPIVKLKRHDFAYHVGGGFEFYLPYFRFAVELKLTNGINNLLIQDNTFFSSPLSSLRSKIWWFSITFEG